ncbi:hypothetical protein G3578_09505 [Brevibacillus sp. SYP-B805]|uniref:hypothetical protein n=1 Tax=Brevibacillus sp. SYP-B805 TaxID=1578199 RepID=UPI0013EAFEDF|nr:hypothetical protein [Brevibacillus sp. SYP-B805]NGQ95391.1 hypothetical protein [Brevibacillus sp. SYP-B805]
MKKKFIGIAIAIAILFYCIHQYHEEPISQTKAVELAKIYVERTNEHMNLIYDSSQVEYVTYNTNPLKELLNTSTWEIFVDGIFVKINAHSGQFVKMVFPADGVITYEEHPEWFDLTAFPQ